MLWKCEEYPPWHPFWDGNDSSIFDSVRSLFNHLLISIDTHLPYLPYYFIPSLNLLENLPESTISKMKTTLKNIVKNVTKHFPDNLEVALGLAERASNLLKEILNRFESFSNILTVNAVLESLKGQALP